MIRATLFTICFASFIAFPSISGMAYCADITYGEVCAGYEQNMRSLGTFRVDVSVVSAATEEHADVLRSRLSKFDRSAAGNQQSRPSLERMALKWRAELKNIESQRESPAPEPKASLTVGADFFQMLIQEVESDAILPKSPLRTQEDLIDVFSSNSVLTWSQRQSPNCWIWHGYGGRSTRDRMYATLSAKRPMDAFNFPVPPLGSRAESLITRGDQASVLDRPFHHAPDAEDSILAPEVLGGVSAIVLKRRTPANHGRHLFVKTWVDPDRGYLPIRIESWRASIDTSLLPGGTAMKVEPFEIITIPDIKELANHSYYPVSWTIENRQDDDRTPEAKQKERVQSIPKYTYRVTKWSIDSVLPNVDPPPLLSEIGFPKGTYCFDETKNEYFTVGAVEAVVDATIQSTPKVVQSPPGTVPPSPPGALKGGWTGRRWFLLANALVIVGLAVFAAVRVFRVDRRARGVK